MQSLSCETKDAPASPESKGSIKMQDLSETNNSFTLPGAESPALPRTEDEIVEYVCYHCPEFKFEEHSDLLSHEKSCLHFMQNLGETKDSPASPRPKGSINMKNVTETHDSLALPGTKGSMNMQTVGETKDSPPLPGSKGSVTSQNVSETNNFPALPGTEGPALSGTKDFEFEEQSVLLSHEKSFHNIIGETKDSPALPISEGSMTTQNVGETKDSPALPGSKGSINMQTVNETKDSPTLPGTKGPALRGTKGTLRGTKGRALRGNKALRILEESCEQNMKFGCPLCPSKFYTSRLRRQHLADRHGVAAVGRLYWCSHHTPPSRFGYLSGLRSHNRGTHHEYHHLCTRCNNVFYAKADVATHDCFY